jgi:hypothetical protein
VLLFLLETELRQDNLVEFINLCDRLMEALNIGERFMIENLQDVVTIYRKIHEAIEAIKGRTQLELQAENVRALLEDRARVSHYSPEGFSVTLKENSCQLFKPATD